MAHFRWLVAGYTLSAFGGYLNIVAIGLYAYLVTGSALHTGLFMALRLLAGFVTGLFSGVLVARYPRKRVMITADLAQATVLASLALAPADAASGLLYLVAVVAGFSSTMFNVSLRSGVPDIVGQEHRVRANAMLATSRSLATVVGMGGAGVIVAWAGFEAAFLINTATYLLSAVNLARLPILREVPKAQDGDTSRNGLRGSFNAVRMVFQTAPVLLVLLLVRAGDGFGSSSHIVGLPVYATQMNPEDPAVFLSQFWVAYAVGNVLTQQIVVRLLKRTVRGLGDRSFAVGAVIMSAAFIAAFSGLSSWSLMLVALVAGLADGYTETAYLSRLQEVDESRRGQLFGLAAVAETSGLGMGMVISAALLGWLSPPTVVTLMHGFAIVLSLGFLTYLVLRLRRRRRTSPTVKVPT